MRSRVQVPIKFKLGRAADGSRPFDSKNSWALPGVLDAPEGEILKVCRFRLDGTPSLEYNY